MVVNRLVMNLTKFLFKKKTILTMLLLTVGLIGAIYVYHPEWLPNRPKQSIDEVKENTLNQLLEIENRGKAVLGTIAELVSPQGTGAAKLKTSIDDKVEKIVNEAIEETKTIIRTKAVIESVKSLPEDEQEIVREYLCRPK